MHGLSEAVVSDGTFGRTPTAAWEANALPIRSKLKRLFFTALLLDSHCP